jgi:hypothetical protein
LVMQMVANSALQSEKLLAGAVSFSGVHDGFCPMDVPLCVAVSVMPMP